jgi:hypothetical protein
MVDCETKINVIISVSTLTTIKFIRKILIFQTNLPTRMSTYEENIL